MQVNQVRNEKLIIKAFIFPYPSDVVMCKHFYAFFIYHTRNYAIL